MFVDITVIDGAISRGVSHDAELLKTSQNRYVSCRITFHKGLICKAFRPACRLAGAANLRKRVLR